MLTQLKYFSEKYIFKKNTEKNGIVTYLQISLNVWLNMTADFPISFCIQFVVIRVIWPLKNPTAHMWENKREKQTIS